MDLTVIIDQAGLNQRAHARLMRDINRQLGERHKSERLRRHFYRNKYTAVGGEYRYQGRTKAWRKRKEKKGVDPLRPNFLTGQMQSDVVGSSIVRATQNRWTVQARNSSFPLSRWRRREMEIIGSSEVVEDMKLRGEMYARLAQTVEYNPPRKKVIRPRGADGKFLTHNAGGG